MPTIQQLPAAVQPSAGDELPVSQGGVTRAVSVGDLLAATQAAITTASNTLLGRVSLGPGGPEPVPMGPGVAISSGALSANGGDHAGFVQRAALTLSDEVVLNSSGTPSRMALPMLRGLFAAGTNVSIDGSGTISAATDPAIVTTLGAVGAQAAAAQSASGSAAAAAGTLAVSVSTLNSQVGTLAGVVVPLSGQIGTLSATVSSVGSTVAGQTAQLGSLSAGVSAAGSLAAAASNVAASAGSSVSTLGSQVGMLSSAVAPLGGQIGTLSATVSSVGSTVAGQTAQLGTLSAGVSAVGSLAAAASSAAASAGSSVSALGSQVGTLSSVVAPLGGQIGTLSATVSSVGSTVAGQTAQLGTLSAGVSAVGSLAAAASSAAASAGSSVSALGSQVGTLSSVVAPLGGQIGTLSATVSSVGSTVAGQTAQLGTLSAGVSAAGSLAAAASSAAASAGSSVSALGSQVGTLSSVVAPLGGQIGTLSAMVSSVGSTVAGQTAQLGTLSAGVSAAGSLAAAASSAAASAGSSVSALGSQVGTLSSAVASGVIASSSTSGSTTTLTNASGGTIVTIVAPAGPPGTLGNGSVRANTASGIMGGPERTLQAIHSDRLRLRMFGAQQNSTTAQGLLGVTTRAQLAAWTNSAGAKPYAFAATQPFTMGDDLWVRLPVAVMATTGSGSSAAPNSTVPLATTLTLASAGYQGQDGHWYLPAPNAAATYYDDMVVTGGSLASGTKVVAVQGATIRITDQPAGTQVPSGTVLTIGADMTKVKVGQQVWATRGLAPLCSIAQVSGATITLSAALASGGLGALQTLNIYTPMAENTLTNSVTMDMLAFCAAYYAAPYGGVVECDPGGYIFSPHVILAGGNVKFVGAGRHCCTLSGTDNAPLVKIFPQAGAEAGVIGLNFGSYAGLMQSFVEIDGGGFGAVAPNAAGCGAVLDDLSGNCSPGPIGAYELVRLRNLGNVRFDNVDFIGLGKTTVGACTLNVGSIILMISRNVTSHYCWRAAIQQGYIEDPICEHWAQDQCGGAWDASRANVFNGLCGLLFKWVGGDNDVTDFILNLPSFLNVNISDACVIFNGQNGGACYILAGCQTGVISGVQGGTAAPGVVDCIHLTSAMVDGGYYPSTQILISAVGVSGFDCAVRIDKGCSGNDVTATLWSSGTGSTNGISPTPVIDSDGRNRVNGVMGTAH